MSTPDALKALARLVRAVRANGRGDEFSGLLEEADAALRQGAQPAGIDSHSVSALRWLLNLTTEFDRKDVRTRQAARLLDEFGSGTPYKTNRDWLEALWSAIKDSPAPHPEAPSQGAQPAAWEPLHDAICQAVGISNMSMDMARSEDGRAISDVLRRALVEFADYASMAAATPTESQGTAEGVHPPTRHCSCPACAAYFDEDCQGRPPATPKDTP